MGKRRSDEATERRSDEGKSSVGRVGRVDDPGEFTGSVGGGERGGGGWVGMDGERLSAQFAASASAPTTTAFPSRSSTSGGVCALLDPLVDRVLDEARRDPMVPQHDAQREAHRRERNHADPQAPRVHGMVGGQGHRHVQISPSVGSGGELIWVARTPVWHVWLVQAWRGVVRSEGR